ncbi:MAG TPA: phosphotransferase [Hyphomonadaceae bacterium]|nr:phosphotransferase [Hyphomonadaceae bacterium]
MAVPTLILDRNHLDMMADGDLELQRELFGLFRTQAELWGRLLDAGAPEGAWADAVHSLKGSARGLGAWALAKACENAEVKPGQAFTRIERAARVAIIREVLDQTLQAIAQCDYDLALSSLRSRSKVVNS